VCHHGVVECEYADGCVALFEAVASKALVDVAGPVFDVALDGGHDVFGARGEDEFAALVCCASAVFDFEARVLGGAEKFLSCVGDGGLLEPDCLVARFDLFAGGFSERVRVLMVSRCYRVHVLDTFVAVLA
jgi:hypothetical protein